MNDPAEHAAIPWTGSRTVKARTAFRRHVTELLDAIAPEKILGKADPKKARIEHHRTPNGCVLQAEDAALSVSWFAEGDQSAGELQVVVWSGVVSRRGAPRREGATMVREEAFHPVAATPEDPKVWRGVDDVRYDTPTLAEHCLALLEAQMHA